MLGRLGLLGWLGEHHRLGVRVHRREDLARVEVVARIDAVEQGAHHGHAGGGDVLLEPALRARRPTAWWCDSVAPRSMNACWMADFTVSYCLSPSAPGASLKANVK